MRSVKGDGQTMLELIMILGVAVVLVAIVVTALTQGLKTGRLSRNRERALRLAEEEAVLLEALRNQMPREAFTYDVTNPVWCPTGGCYIQEITGAMVTGGSEVLDMGDAVYRREFYTEWPSTQCVNSMIGVRIQVAWGEPGGERQVASWKCLAPPPDYR
jgi:Tfp pilus assembly protein FimT